MTALIDRTYSGVGIMLQAGAENLFKTPLLAMHPLELFSLWLGSGAPFYKNAVSKKWVDHV